MAFSFITYQGDGSTVNFAVPLGFISRDHVAVTVDDVPVAFTWINDGMIQATVAPTVSEIIKIERTTPKVTPIVDFQDASVVTEEDLDTNSLQLLYIAQEAFDESADTLGLGLDGKWDAESLQLKNIATPTEGNDAVNKTYADQNLDATNAAAAAAAASAAAAAAAATAAENAIPMGTLGYDPVDKAGDTMTGALTVPTLTVSGTASINTMNASASATVPDAGAADNSTKAANTAWVRTNLTALLDAVFGSTRGLTLRRGASAWQSLALGANGTYLGSNGTDVVYSTPPSGLAAASAAQMEAASSNTVAVTPGVQHRHPAHPKAWVYCNSAGTIQTSYGVSSVSKTGTGEYTVTLGTAYSSSSISLLATSNTTGAAIVVQAIQSSTSQFLIKCRQFYYDGVPDFPLTDSAFSFVIFGDI